MIDLEMESTLRPNKGGTMDRTTFPIMSFFNISSDVFNMNRKFKPKGSVRRMQMVIETTKLLMEQEDDEEVTLDSLSDCDWTGFSTAIKRKAESIIEGKSPNETFFEVSPDEKITLPQLRFAKINIEEYQGDEGEMQMVIHQEENNNISFNNECLAAKRWDDLNETQTTIITEAPEQKTSSNESITKSPCRKKNEYFKDSRESGTGRRSARIQNKCLMAPRNYFNVSPSTHLTKPVLHAPEISTQPQMKQRSGKSDCIPMVEPDKHFERRKSKMYPNHLLKPRSNFKGGNSRVSTIKCYRDGITSAVNASRCHLHV